ncbi:MAG: type II secretion system protein GspG [Planctomycetota bacterium]
MVAVARNARGFTIVEMTFALGISALLFGLALPVMTSVLTEYRQEVARGNLAELKAAIRRYCQDTGILCTALANLAAANNVTGWSGPYVAPTNDDAANSSALPLDPWGHGFTWLPSGLRCGTLTCLGGNGVNDAGAGDDITTSVDVTDILREKTLLEVAKLNQAIEVYNKINLPTTFLPSNITTLVTTLIAGGFLFGSVLDWTTDAFGSTYVPGPAPVQQVTVANLP